MTDDCTVLQLQQIDFLRQKTESTFIVLKI